MGKNTIRGLLALAVFCGTAYAERIPIEVIKANALNTGVGINAPVVTVQVCEPGTQKCVTIPHILIDTGSVGLRLFSPPAGLNLPVLHDQNGGTISERVRFAEGACLWGPVGQADVKLGSQTFANLNLQINNTNYPFVPDGCSSIPQDEKTFGFNGLLGVAPAVLDCLDGLDDDCSSETLQYYTCDTQSCESATVFKNQEILNPIAINHNGFTLSFPALPKGDSAQAGGSLVLGEDPPPANQSVIHTSAQGAFRAVFNGVERVAILDSGTAWDFLPNVDTSETCKMDSDHPPLCPSSVETRSLELMSVDESSEAATEVEIGNYLNEVARGSVASDDLTVSDPDAGHQMYVILGMSYLFGKDIYFGFNHKATPFGQGPLFALPASGN